MKKTLIIGKTSLLASKLGFPEGKGFLSPGRRELDLTNDPRSYFLHLKKSGVDLQEVILIAAYTDVSKANNEDRELAYLTNVRGVADVVGSLSALFNESMPRLVYISSDYVFDGEKGMYKPYEPTNPVQSNYYAYTKAAGESIVLSYGNHLIIRTSFCQDDEWPYRKAFYDQYTSRDRVSIIGPMVRNWIDNKSVNGIVHVGTERKSVIELAQSIDPTVEPISRSDISDVFIPHDTSLEIS